MGLSIAAYALLLLYRFRTMGGISRQEIRTAHKRLLEGVLITSKPA
ncbi:MAG: hypothetical protein ACK41E_09635 [Deinococcales bacterium]